MTSVDSFRVVPASACSDQRLLISNRSFVQGCLRGWCWIASHPGHLDASAAPDASDSITFVFWVGTGSPRPGGPSGSGRSRPGRPPSAPASRSACGGRRGHPGWHRPAGSSLAPPPAQPLLPQGRRHWPGDSSLRTAAAATGGSPGPPGGHRLARDHTAADGSPSRLSASFSYSTRGTLMRCACQSGPAAGRRSAGRRRSAWWRLTMTGEQVHSLTGSP